MKIIESHLINQYPSYKKIIDGKGDYDWHIDFPHKGEPDLTEHYSIRYNCITNLLDKVCWFKITDKIYHWHFTYSEIHDVSEIGRVGDILRYIEVEPNIEFKLVIGGEIINIKSKGKNIVNLPLLCMSFCHVNVILPPPHTTYIAHYWLIDNDRRLKYHQYNNYVVDILGYKLTFSNGLLTNFVSNF